MYAGAYSDFMEFDKVVDKVKDQEALGRLLAPPTAATARKAKCRPVLVIDEEAPEPQSPVFPFQ